jgi:hypothetical protein
MSVAIIRRMNKFLREFWHEPPGEDKTTSMAVIVIVAALALLD